jgi:hypothetical protein
MFKCRACEAHKAHIESLKAEIETLRVLTGPPPMPTFSPVVEQLAPFSTGDAPPSVYPEAELRRAEREALESAAIFAGEVEELGQTGIN